MLYESIETLVIGGGVIGLAVARSLAMNQQQENQRQMRQRQVVVVEKEDTLAQHSSSRNSEVIHAGIYYPSSSLKAKFCLKGRELLYDYLAQHKIPHKKIQKLIISTHEDEEALLDAIYQQGLQNQVVDLQKISSYSASQLEPNITCTEAILSPSTGILDSHQYLKSLQRDVVHNQGIILLQHHVIAIDIVSDGYLCTIQGNTHHKAYQIHCQELVNCGGLWAHDLAHMCHDHSSFPYIPRKKYAQGYYLRYRGPQLSQRLIYPLPEIGGLGIHLTLDLQGNTRFGPNVEWVDEIDYSHTMQTPKSEFHRAIRKYIPNIRLDDLSMDYCGIRIKNDVLPHSVSDFTILDSHIHQHKGLVHLLAMESPGLTASLAIADEITQRLNQDKYLK